MSKSLSQNLKESARGAASMAPLSPAEEVNALSPRRVLASMFRHARLIIGLTLTGAAITAYLALSTPNSYTSQGTFLFTSGSETLKLDQDLGGSPEGEGMVDNATYVFRADGLLGRVVDKVGLKKLLAPELPKEGAFLETTRFLRTREVPDDALTRTAALKVLQENLGVNKPRRQEVLLVTYTAGSPALAQEILNTYMSEAKRWHLEVYNDNERLKLVEEKAQDVANRLETAKSTYKDFLAGLDVFDFQIELSRRQEDEARRRAVLDSTESEINALNLRLARVAEQMKDTPKTVRREVELGTEDAKLIAYNNNIANLEIEIQALKAQVREGVETNEIKTKVKAMERLTNQRDVYLEERGGAETRELDVENPDYRALLTLKSTLTAEFGNRDAVLPAFRSEHRKAVASLEELAMVEPRHRELTGTIAGLQTEKESADRQLAQVLRKRELDAGAFSSLKEIDQASLPLVKAGPNRTKLVLIGIFGGLFAALGIVVLKTLGDSLVRSRDELERATGVPVLGTIPRLDGKNIRRHRNLREQVNT